MNHETVVDCWAILETHLSTCKVIHFQGICEQLRNSKKSDDKTMSDFFNKVRALCNVADTTRSRSGAGTPKRGCTATTGWNHKRNRGRTSPFCSPHDLHTPEGLYLLIIAFRYRRYALFGRINAWERQQKFYNKYSASSSPYLQNSNPIFSSPPIIYLYCVSDHHRSLHAHR